MRTITIANQKGGVAKTTTAVTLAHDLARRGHTVCLVDMDAQGNASSCLGVTPAPGLYTLLRGVANLEDVLQEVRPNLWLLGGDVNTAKLKAELAGEAYREALLARELAGLDVDFCILDTSPSRDLLHDLAHHAANEAIIPVALDHLALIGVAQELATLEALRRIGRAVTVTAILPTFWDRTTRESEANLAQLVQNFGDLVLPAVPRATKVREAPAVGLTVWEYLRETDEVCRAYARLTERVLYGR